METQMFARLDGIKPSLAEIRKRIEHVKNIIIKHPQYNEVFDELGMVHELSQGSVNPDGLFICGPTGAGKTTLLNDYTNQFPRVVESEFTRIPVLYVKVPPKATPKMLASKILHIIGDPCHDRGTLSLLTSRIHNYVVECHMEMIILDEFQHLIDSETDHVLATASNWVKTFAEECNVPIVLCGMPESEKIFVTNEQLDRRFCNKLTLDPFRYNTKEEQVEFRKFLAHIDKELPFAKKSNIADSSIAAKLYYISLGVPFYVMEMMAKATRFALQKGKDCLDEEVLNQAFQKIKRSGRPFTINPFTVNNFDLNEVIQLEKSHVKKYEERKATKKNEGSKAKAKAQ